MYRRMPGNRSVARLLFEARVHRKHREISTQTDETRRVVNPSAC